MTADTKNELPRILKQRRLMVSITLQELSRSSGVSVSHLGLIERGERFPSARILRKIAKALGLSENELFTLAGFLTPQSSGAVEMDAKLGQLDPYVASVLSREPSEIQRAVVGILSVIKIVAEARALMEKGMLESKGTGAD